MQNNNKINNPFLRGNLCGYPLGEPDPAPIPTIEQIHIEYKNNNKRNSTLLPLNLGSW